jgi:hypothetical protein
MDIERDDVMKTHISLINVGELFRIGLTKSKPKMDGSKATYELTMTNFLDEIVITGITVKELRRLEIMLRRGVLNGRKRNDKDTEKSLSN